MWKKIEECPNYSINEVGEVRRDDVQKLIKPRLNKQNISMVSLSHEGAVVTKSLALLVAKLFLPEPRNKVYNSVIHLNGDKADCRAVNLMWRPRTFVVRYHRMFNDEPLRKSIYIPIIEKQYTSIREFCVEYGMIEGDVFSCIISGKKLFHYGWVVYFSRQHKKEKVGV